MDDTKVEKIDDDTVKVSTTTADLVDVSSLKQDLRDAQTQLQNFEDWTVSQRVALQGNLDAAQSILDKVSAVGVDITSSDEITP